MKLFKKSTLLALSLVALAPIALIAGTGGSEFDPIWSLLTDWAQGSLGRIIAGSTILVGVIAGIARQSIMSFAVGIGAGVGLFYAPTIIDAVVGGALPVA